MIISIEKRVISVYDERYIFIANNKKHLISKSLYEAFIKQYYKTNRSQRYESIEETYGAKYTFDISNLSWQDIKPKYATYIQAIKKYTDAGFKGEDLKRKIMYL